VVPQIYGEFRRELVKEVKGEVKRDMNGWFMKN